MKLLVSTKLHPSQADLWLLLSCRLPSIVDHLAARMTTDLYLLADAATADPGAALQNVQAATDSAVTATSTASKNGGFFGIFASSFEQFLKVWLGS